MKKLIISPLFETYFSGRVWMGLDYERIAKVCESNLPDYEVEIIEFKDLYDTFKALPQSSVIFYSTIYKDEYLKYIKDVVFFIELHRPDIILLPNQFQLKSFINKGFQEYYKQYLNINSLKGYYYGDVVDYDYSLPVPLVLKENEQAMSKGVTLVQRNSEIRKFGIESKKLSLRKILAQILNRHNSFKKDFNFDAVEKYRELNFEKFFSERQRFTIQEFIPNLKVDYKVLIFGDNYFCMERKVRDNDFRASGSGKNSWGTPPVEVLHFAKEVFEKMNVPHISIDIGIDKENNCYLFEYQGTSFGPVALTPSDKFWNFINGEWIYVSAKSDLEEQYATSIISFLKNKF